MKKYTLGISSVLILILVTSGVALGALPGTGWQVSYAVMNVGGASGSLPMTAYDKNSATTYTSSTFNFDDKESLRYMAGEAATYPAGDKVDFSTSLPSGFEGSVVVLGSVALASAATLENVNVGGGTALSRYQGVGEVTTEILFPVVKHNWWNQTTTFYVQAAGSDANVTITYEMNDASTHTQTTTISANKMFVFDPANATPAVASSSCGTSANTSPCFGAATVTSSTGPIAGVVVEHPHIGSPAAFVLSTRGLTSSDKAPIIFATSTKNYYWDATGGFAVMNTGAATANARIDLTVIDVQPGSDADTAGVVKGDTYTDDELISPGASVVFGPFDANLGGMPRGIYATAKVTSIDDATYDPQLLVGTSNEAKTAPLLSGGKAKAVYYGFVPANATDKSACPIVTELLGGDTGGMTVVNVGNALTTVHFEYVEYNGTNYHFWSTSTLAPGEGIGTNRVSNNPGGKFTNDGSWLFSAMAGKIFSAYIYSSNGEEIIALSQEASTTFANDIRNYECVNLQ